MALNRKPFSYRYSRSPRLKRCQFPKCRSAEIQITYLGKHLCGKHWIKISTLPPEKARNLLKLPQSRGRKPTLHVIEIDHDPVETAVPAEEAVSKEPPRSASEKRAEQPAGSRAAEAQPAAQLLFFAETASRSDSSPIAGGLSRKAPKKKRPSGPRGREARKKEKTDPPSGTEQLNLFLPRTSRSG